VKATSLVFSASLAVLASAALLAVGASAQAPPTASPASAGALAPPRVYPAPTNLQVLPKDLTGQQVHEIMEQWEAALGSHCSTCHVADPKNIGPNGRPRLNFPDDSRPEKQTARRMFTMVEGINRDYISKIDSSGAPVTCGTCHRGHLGPEPFVAPPDDDRRTAPAPGTTVAPQFK
jgi:hypothetical protein